MIRPAGNQYSMIESGSHPEPETWCGLSLSRTLWRVWSSGQKFGAPRKYASTLGSSQTMPANGFWCSCGMPSVCPISCSAVVWPYGVVRSQSKFIVRSFAGIPSTSRADVRPRSVALLEADPHLRLVAIGDLDEVQADAEVLPRRERRAHDVLLVVRTVEEVVVQDGPVDPLPGTADDRRQRGPAEVRGERRKPLRRCRAMASVLVRGSSHSQGARRVHEWTWRSSSIATG